MKFHDRLNAFSAEKNCTLTALAAFCRVTPQAAQQWSAGVTTPRGKRLAEIAEFLGVSEVALMYGDEATDSQPIPAVKTTLPVYITDWPFKRIDPKRVINLGHVEISKLEETLEALITAAEKRRGKRTVL